MFRSVVAHPAAFRRALLGALALALTACSGTPSVSPSRSAAPPPGASSTPALPGQRGSEAPGSLAPTDAGPAASAEPDASGGTTTGGDIPDNAVFLTYHDAAHPFSIDYVEGWQVTPTGDGVVIRDKDSSETVQILASASDLTAYINATDLPALQATDGYKLMTRDTRKIHGTQIDHLQYEQLSPADPVTNKRIPSLVDRYYIAGAAGLAVISLSTPRKVDNVDAFKQMVDSFGWK